MDEARELDNTALVDVVLALELSAAGQAKTHDGRHRFHDAHVEVVSHDPGSRRYLTLVETLVLHRGILNL